MKSQRAIGIAKEIGDMHFDLLHFNDLPKNASKKKQVEALRRDQRWQEDHQNEMSKHIDHLIDHIEENQ